MFAVAEKQKNVTRALLVSAWWKPQTAEEGRSLLEELAELADTLGLTVADRVLVQASTGRRLPISSARARRRNSSRRPGRWSATSSFSTTS